MSLLRRALLPLVLALGCGAPAAVPGPAAPAPASAPRTDSLAGPWTLRAPSPERSNTIELFGTLASRADSIGAIERTDTLRARVRAVASRVTGGEGERFAGLLHQYELSTGDSVPFAAPAGLLLPLPFTAMLGARGRAPALEPPATGECSIAAAALQPLRELWVSMPARLSVGQEWTDTTSHAICRDSVLLVVDAVREHRVIGAEVDDGQLVLRIHRESRTHVSGEGNQFGEPIRIAAEGTGRMEYLVSLAGGEVVRGEGDSALEMRLTGRRRSQVLRQVTRILISSP